MLISQRSPPKLAPSVGGENFVIDRPLINRLAVRVFLVGSSRSEVKFYESNRHLLCVGRPGSVYPPDRRLWRAGRGRRRSSTLPPVQAGHLRAGSAHATQYRSRSAVPVPPL